MWQSNLDRTIRLIDWLSVVDRRFFLGSVALLLRCALLIVKRFLMFGWQPLKYNTWGIPYHHCHYSLNSLSHHHPFCPLLLCPPSPESGEPFSLSYLTSISTVCLIVPASWFTSPSPSPSVPLSVVVFQPVSKDISSVSGPLLLRGLSCGEGCLRYDLFWRDDTPKCSAPGRWKSFR